MSTLRNIASSPKGGWGTSMLIATVALIFAYDTHTHTHPTKTTWNRQREGAGPAGSKQHTDIGQKGYG